MLNARHTTAAACAQQHLCSSLRRQCSRRPCRVAAFSSLQLQDPILESAFSTESCTRASTRTDTSRTHHESKAGYARMQQQQEAQAATTTNLSRWHNSSRSSSSSSSSGGATSKWHVPATRRQANQLLLLPPTLAAAAGASWLTPPAATASKLPGFADSAWEALGGGPPDLFFPEEWLGVWDVVSTLTKVDLLLGEDLVSNLGAVQRAQQQDLDQPQSYQVAFMRNQSQRVIYDRRFNTAALLASYYGPKADFSGRIAWNPNDPNVLSLTVPGGLSVRTRVTRRSESSPSPQRLETSEYLEQVFDSSEGGAPRVKASQCFTKYLWRDEAEAGEGPAIVATQVVSDYLTPYDGEQRYLAAMNKPVTTYTYKMAFRRHHEAGHTAAALTTS